jgi:hypothetical protein
MLITETSRIPEFYSVVKDLSFRGTSQSQGNEFPLALLGLRNPVSVSQQMPNDGWLADESRSWLCFVSEFALNRKKR